MTTTTTEQPAPERVTNEPTDWREALAELSPADRERATRFVQFLNEHEGKPLHAWPSRTARVAALIRDVRADEAAALRALVSDVEAIRVAADKASQDIVYKPGLPSEAPALQARIYRETRALLIRQMEYVARLQGEVNALRAPVDVRGTLTALTDQISDALGLEDGDSDAMSLILAEHVEHAARLQREAEGLRAAANSEHARALRFLQERDTAREDGKRQMCNHVADRLMNKWFPLLHMMLNDRQRAEMLLDLGATLPGIEQVRALGIDPEAP